MPNTRTKSGHGGDITFVRRVFIVVAVGALVAAVWVLSDILLLLFGSILFAVILHAAAAPLEGMCGSAARPALAPGARSCFWSLQGRGSSSVPSSSPRCATYSRPCRKPRTTWAYFQLGSLADMIRDGAAASALGGLASRIIAWSTTLAGALASLLLVLFGGIYLATNPAFIVTASSSWCRRLCSPTSPRRSTTAGKR